jgi:putative peptidoglycan lipid II flippase
MDVGKRVDPDCPNSCQHTLLIRLGDDAMWCSTYLIDQAMASLLPAGSVAAVNYRNKLVALVLAAGTMALGTAVLPYFSKMAAATDWRGLKHTPIIYARLILLVTVPLTIAGMWFSKPLVSILLQRGRFTADDAQVVSAVQSMYLLQLPFSTLSILLVRIISSLQANRFLLLNTVVGLTVNIVLDYVLMRVMGVTGIALSRSVVYVASCSVLTFVLFRKLKVVENNGLSMRESS